VTLSETAQDFWKDHLAIFDIATAYRPRESSCRNTGSPRSARRSEHRAE
jgi:hypothetical protein